MIIKVLSVKKFIEGGDYPLQFSKLTLNPLNPCFIHQHLKFFFFKDYIVSYKLGCFQEKRTNNSFKFYIRNFVTNSSYGWIWMSLYCDTKTRNIYKKKCFTVYYFACEYFFTFSVFYNNREIDQWNMAFPCNVFPTEKTLRHQCQSCFGNLFLKYFLFKNILK